MSRRKGRYKLSDQPLTPDESPQGGQQPARCSLRLPRPMSYGPAVEVERCERPFERGHQAVVHHAGVDERRDGPQLLAGLRAPAAVHAGTLLSRANAERAACRSGSEQPVQRDGSTSTERHRSSKERCTRTKRALAFMIDADGRPEVGVIQLTSKTNRHPGPSKDYTVQDVSAAKVRKHSGAVVAHLPCGRFRGSHPNGRTAREAGGSSEGSRRG